ADGAHRAGDGHDRTLGPRDAGTGPDLHRRPEASAARRVYQLPGAAVGPGPAAPDALPGRDRPARGGDHRLVLPAPVLRPGRGRDRGAGRGGHRGRRPPAHPGGLAARSGCPVSLVIEARGLEKRYGTTQVLRGVDLDVRSGEVCCLLGPNGAGKTTTVEIFTGFLKATEST